jgi:hypothetical protein
LRHNQHGISAAGDQLFDQPISFQDAFDVVIPTVEVNNEIYLAGFAKTLGYKNSNRVICVMLCGGKELVFILMPLGSLRMGKWSSGKMNQEQLAWLGKMLGKGFTPADRHKRKAN